MIVTIDGPVASGKSSVARLVAAHHEWYYINSGLFFRIIAYVLMQAGHTFEQLAAVQANDLHDIVLEDIVYTYQNGREAIAYRGVDMTNHLKNQRIDQAASLVSINACVREMVLRAERALSQRHDVVIDGRDTGSIVFPAAQIKIYLTADVIVRAKRWQRLLQEKGHVVEDAQAVQEIKQRDERDMKRALAPLVVPDGATIIDSTALSIEQVVAIIDQKIMHIKKGAD